MSYGARSGMLIKVSGLKSRFRGGQQRTVILHYTKVAGGALKLADTLCNCDGGRRVIGGCAHSIAVLRFLHEKKSGSNEPITTKSEQDLLQSFKIELERLLEGDDDD